MRRGRAVRWHGRGDRGDHAAHRGGGHPLRRLVVRAAGGGPDGRCAAHHPRAHAQAGDGVERGWAGEHSVCHPARQGLCHRGEPARLAHGALCVEGSRRAAGQDRIAADGGAHVEGAAAGCSGQRRRPRHRSALLCEVAGLSVGQVPRRGHGAGAGDEVHRRGDGRGRQLRRGLCQGADRRRPDAAREGNDLPQRERPRQGRRRGAGADLRRDGLSSGGDARHGGGAGGRRVCSRSASTR